MQTKNLGISNSNSSGSNVQGLGIMGRQPNSASRLTKGSGNQAAQQQMGGLGLNMGIVGNSSNFQSS